MEAGSYYTRPGGDRPGLGLSAQFTDGEEATAIRLRDGLLQVTRKHLIINVLCLADALGDGRDTMGHEPCKEDGSLEERVLTTRN